MVSFLRQFGRPKLFTFDRDPRWVGAASGRDFPSAFVRFLLCIGVEPNICPPHHPQDNCHVERYHRAYGEECLRVFRPGTEEEVREVTDAFLTHYNWERPNQARSCGNRPPRVAFPTLPTLPALPEHVDPDAWLAHIHRQAYARRGQSKGTSKWTGTRTTSNRRSRGSRWCWWSTRRSAVLTCCWERGGEIGGDQRAGGPALAV